MITVVDLQRRKLESEPKNLSHTLAIETRKPETPPKNKPDQNQGRKAMCTLEPLSPHHDASIYQKFEFDGLDVEHHVFGLNMFLVEITMFLVEISLTGRYRITDIV